MPNVPPLRFPEFSGEWEKFALSDFTERVTRRNKGNACRLPLTISAQYGLVDQITFFNKQIASADMSNYYLMKKGEFTYNKSYSGDYPWGAVKRLDRYDEGCLSSLYICFSLKPFVNSDFITHYFETTKWYRGVSEIAGEGARNHGLLNIAIPDYFATKHYLPASSEEQQKIADLFNLLTKRIETQIRVIDKLESLIKGIRATVFNNVQPNTKLGEIADIYQPQTIASTECNRGQYLVFGANGVIGRYEQYNHEQPQICITCRGNTCGTVNFSEPFSWITGNAMVINIDNNKEVNKRYLFHYLSTQNFHHIISGSGQPQIVRSPLLKFPIYLPSMQTQVKLAEMLDLLRSRLKTEQDILEKYQQQKAYLLQNMFI